MLMIKLFENDHLLNAEFALKQASSDNIISLCENYLLLLNNYRNELYQLRGTPEINVNQGSSLARELVDQTRKAIRAAVEATTQKRNHIESLLKSFTTISGYEAVKTFNQLEYKGFSDWELRANQVRLVNDDNNEQFTIQEAVEIAGKLRRTVYILYKTTFFT